jgi:MFS family permease
MSGIQLLRTNQNYRNLWLASVGSQFGNWSNEVALAQVTLTLTHSPVVMGLVLLCRSLPAVILGPFAGLFVDGFPKRPFLFLTDLVRALFALALSLAVVLHAAWVLYVGSALLGVSGVLFGPARNAAIPLIVSRDDLAAANGLESQASGLIQIIGAACGGIVSRPSGRLFVSSSTLHHICGQHGTSCVATGMRQAVLEAIHRIFSRSRRALRRRFITVWLGPSFSSGSVGVSLAEGITSCSRFLGSGFITWAGLASECYTLWTGSACWLGRMW